MKPDILAKTKLDRRRVFARHLATLPPPPCGCVLKLASCGCREESCVCAAEIEFCDCEWPIEYLRVIGSLLAVLDPGNYAEPPLATTPVMLMGREQRIAVYEARAESGMSLWHPDDCKPDRRKNGCLINTLRNGGIRFSGASDAPDTTFRSRWKGGSKERRAFADRSESMSVDDLVACMDR